MEEVPADTRDEELRQAFALRVERLRAARGLSRKQLANRVSSRTAFGRWNKGKAWPRVETLYRLSEALGVTLDFLMLGRGPMSPAGSVDPRVLNLLETLYELPIEAREALAQAILGQGSPAAGKAPR